MALATPPTGARGRLPALAASWVVVAAGVLLCYLAVVVGGRFLFGDGPRTRLALALLATVVVALAMEPVRRRVHVRLARLLAGSPQQPYELLSGFAEQLGDPGSVEEMTGRMARVLAEGTAAAWTQVWLMVHGDLQLVASWPPGAVTDTVPPPVAARQGAGVHSVPVGHGGDVLGVLRVREREGRSMAAVESRLFAGLAAQAGLLLAKAQMQAELRARVDRLAMQAGRLRAARTELVTASDVERRRLERDLHDGAQQELVALSINLGLARTLLAHDPARAGQTLTQQADAAEAAIDTLLMLSRGLTPVALVRDGLPAALRAAAATSALPVTARLDGVRRYARDVEVTVYYCAVEALANAAKHSGGTSIELVLREERGAVELTVTDDGSGVPSDRPATGTGLAGMRRRAAAVGGTLTVDGHPGRGTTVRLTVPAGPVPP